MGRLPGAGRVQGNYRVQCRLKRGHLSHVAVTRTCAVEIIEASYSGIRVPESMDCTILIEVVKVRVEGNFWCLCVGMLFRSMCEM